MWCTYTQVNNMEKTKNCACWKCSRKMEMHTQNINLCIQYPVLENAFSNLSFSFSSLRLYIFSKPHRHYSTAEAVASVWFVSVVLLAFHMISRIRRILFLLPCDCVSTLCYICVCITVYSCFISFILFYYVCCFFF